MVEDSSKTFLVPVISIQPNYEGLRAAFDWVRDEYSFVAAIGFQPIEVCQSVSCSSGEVTFEYVHLGRVVTSEEVLAEMERRGLRPALYEEILSFAAKHRFEQMKFPIAALGSICQCPDGVVAVSYIYRFGTKRDLRLHLFDEPWAHFYRFLAVCK